MMRAAGLVLALIGLAACSGEIGPGEPAPGKSAPGKPSEPADSSPTLEAAAEQCRSAEPAAPVLRRLTRRQLDYTLRDAFPEVARHWQGIAVGDVSSKLGFSNDASLLVVSPQLAGELQTSAEALADLAVAAVAPCGSCARELVTRYGERLFRRPLTAAELDRYSALFNSVSATGSFQQALKWTLVALMQSPATLYRRELGELSSFDLASALSYTYADEPPDAELRALAERGELNVPEIRVREARRLLATERGHAVVQQFFREWLRFGSVQTSDRPAIERFDAVRSKLLDEMMHFIDAVVYDDEGGLDRILTAPYTFADRELAEYYGSSASSDQLAQLPRKDGQGIGILAQGALLASAANVEATSPTHRGLLVHERLLCRSRPTPPPNVPPLGSTNPGTYRTTRERYEIAHAQGFCMGCHEQFDPLGFAFEHFDQGGRYRADEGGAPIDASGQVLARDRSLLFAFDGAEALARGLAEQAEVADCVSGLAVAYAFGGARCVAEDARASFRTKNMGLLELLAQLAAAPSFAERSGRAMPAEPEPAKEPELEPPASGAGTVELGIVAEYQANNDAPSDNVIGPYFKLTNATGTAPVALEQITIRYYFSNEHSAMCPAGCIIEGYYAGIQPTGAAVQATRRYVQAARDSAYLEIGFEPGSPSLMPGQSVEVQQQFHTSPYEIFDESNDYSFAADAKSFTQSAKITVHHDGALAWGTPPP